MVNLNPFGFFKSPCRITVNFADGSTRQQVLLTKENGQTAIVPLFQSQANIVGEVVLEPVAGQAFYHNGVKIELLGQIEICYETGHFSEFTSLVRKLDDPGYLHERTTYPFEFSTVDFPYESYDGDTVKLRYILKVTVCRSYFRNIVACQGFLVQNFTPPPSINNNIKMEVGSEGRLHFEIEYFKSQYHLKELITGKINFLSVSVKIKKMEIEIRRRESAGSGAKYVETKTIGISTLINQFDKAPVSGDSVPVGVFLGLYELTPTYRNVHNKFSVKYLLNLVLVDEEDRRYFKQQEVILYRLESP